MTEKILIFIVGLLMLSCMKSNEPIIAEEKPPFTMNKDTISYLALGDSYTIGQSVNQKERFPVQLMDSLEKNYDVITKLEIIATTGWRTDDLLNAMDRENPQAGNYNFITLLIGVNNQYQGRPIEQYKEELEVLIKRSIDLLEGKSQNLILVSIPDYGVTPFASGGNPLKIATELNAYNEIKEQMAVKFNVRYVYITDISKQAKFDLTLLASDELHPSGKMYGLWVDRIYPEMINILGL